MRYTIYAKGFYCFPRETDPALSQPPDRNSWPAGIFPARVFIRRLLVLADFGIRKLCSYITSGRRVSASG